MKLLIIGTYIIGLAVVFILIALARRKPPKPKPVKMGFGEFLRIMHSRLNQVYMPIEGRIKCNFIGCVNGMGLAGRGICSGGGAWWMTDCPSFEDEEEYEKACGKRADHIPDTGKKVNPDWCMNQFECNINDKSVTSCLGCGLHFRNIQL